MRTSNKTSMENLQKDFGEWDNSLCLDLDASLDDKLVESFLLDGRAVVLAALLARKVVLVTHEGFFELHLQIVGRTIVRRRRRLELEELGLLCTAEKIITMC